MGSVAEPVERSEASHCFNRDYRQKTAQLQSQLEKCTGHVRTERQVVFFVAMAAFDGANPTVCCLLALRHNHLNENILE